MWSSIIQLMLSLGAIFVVTTFLLGLDPWSAAIITVTISCILIDLIGLMYWWSIDFNAISVVNLVMVAFLEANHICFSRLAFPSSSARTSYVAFRLAYNEPAWSVPERRCQTSDAL